MDRRPHHESSYLSNRSADYYGRIRRERDYDSETKRRDFDYASQSRTTGEGSRSSRHYLQEGDERSGHRKRAHDRLDPQLERRQQQQYQQPSQSSYCTESPVRGHHSKHLLKQRKKRKHLEEEEDRILRDIEKRRERERQREKGDAEESPSDNHKRSKKVRNKEFEHLDPRPKSHDSSENDDGELLDLTVSDEDLLPKVEEEPIGSSDSEHGDEMRRDETNTGGKLSNAPSDISSDSEPRHSRSHSPSPSTSSNSESSQDESSSDSKPSLEHGECRPDKVGNGKDKHKQVKERKRSSSESEMEADQRLSNEEEEVIPLSKDEEAVAAKPDSAITKREEKPQPEVPERELTEVEKACLELEALPAYYPAIQGCRRVEEFALLNRIEEGTYGVVYRAKDKRTNEIVALKRLKMEKEKDGFPITSLREINTLLKAQHENIVTVREIVVGSNTDKIFLVMDYVEHDLKSLMETLRQKKQEFIMGEVKCLLIQLLRAVAHLHDNWILHRDLKTSNLLLSHKGILKVGDFGLAREYGSPLKSYTPIVVTLWYRGPELLLGAKEYSTPIDVWSVGCIFGELLKMEPMFPGKSEANQLNLIFQTLGTPNDKIWPGYSKLPLLQKMTFGDYPVNKLKTKFGILSDPGVDLMNKFLTYNPAKRVTAADALEHSFFREAPLPIDPSIFPTWPAKSEMGIRKHASPKPPSGGRQYKDLKEDDSIGFFVGVGDRKPPVGAGFSLKF